ncbi:hypothetical protein Mboo_1860 [Methanoregula boonei 6A8]|jgi:hypothetical protein|uniref:Uncharacterized protein n=1 Tax=Methanoregula boonei (strain DSM 21154 / JCM 14090 / 6A8) TaxID=456442 RepID=A7I9G4_METB6|nr:hypothetical protein [Methanoregula boonei]ABS56375.1 hypothetical protein Mboo_1860 [Methanoregula boonei 6A8]
MSREKIKVPGNVYEELVALEREIHFTLDTQDTVKRAEDRGYMAAANWIRNNEEAYKVGFSWGFEPAAEEPQGMIRDIPQRSEPVQRRTVAHPPPIQATRPEPQPPRTPQRRSSSGSSTGIIAGIKKWINKYF